MRLTLLCLLLLASCALHGQSTGYLGYRYYLKADFGSMISRGPTANNRGLNGLELYGNNKKGSFAMNTQFGLQAGFALSRADVLLAEFSQLNTGLSTVALTPVVNDPATASQFDTHHLFYNVRSRSVGLGYQHFLLKKGSLAPFGSFISFYLNWNFAAGEIIDKRTFYYNSAAPEVHAKFSFEPKVAYASGGIGIGRNFILADRFLLGFEWRLNFPLRLFYLYKGNIQPHPSNRYSRDGAPEYNRKHFENEAFNRLILHNFLYIKIGAGYLLY